MTEEQLLLITAAVDGCLSEWEAERFRRLVDSSAEARAVFESLKSDRDRLAGLARVQLPRGLHASIMAGIAGLAPPFDPVTATGRAVSPVRHRQWVPVAIAASLLIGIAGATFLVFTRDRDTARVARDPASPPPATRDGAADPRWNNWLPAERSELPAAPMPSRKRDGNTPDRRQPLLPVQSVAIAPEPRVTDRDLIGARPKADLPEFSLVEVRIPFLETLADFDREVVRQQLAEELGRDPAFRIDLFARNMPRGVELFRAAARGSGLTVHADAATLAHLRKGQLAAVAVYTDSFTAEQLAALFARLSSEDARVSPRVFDVLHAAPVAREDEVDIRRVLGTDPGLFKRAIPSPDRPKEPDKGKSVSDVTADQIVKSIAAKGKDASAVLMAWSPVQGRTPPAASAELKAYLARRGERKPDAVPVIIVIRQGNG